MRDVGSLYKNVLNACMFGVQILQCRGERYVTLCKKTYFASRAKAMVADTIGVEELVPVKPSVHSPFRVVVL